MRRLIRIFAIAVLVAFNAAAVAHAANVTNMPSDMSLAGSSDGDMADCQDCSGEDGKVVVCDQICVMPFVALSPGSMPAPPALVADCECASAGEIAGQLGPPDHNPPQTGSLI
jgi:hypothetical protein